MQHIGKLYYRAHSATPIVIGDFEAMKSWGGDPDGEAEGSMTVGGAEAFGFSAQDLASPEVYTHGTSVVLLVKIGSYGRTVEPPAGEALRSLVEQPFDDEWESEEIAAPSGALVLTLAYNATPAHDADTSDLDELCFYAGVPRMPAEIPTEPLYLTELIVLPVAAGTYSIQTGRVGEWERAAISPA
jgi:hypothetical protein